MDKRCDFLLEVGLEEVPAGFLPKAALWLEEHGRKALGDALLEPSGVTVRYTPRRLVFHATGMLSRQRDLDVKVFGPPKNMAFDQDGTPTPAALGFAAKNGVAVTDLTLEEHKKGMALCARVRQPGREASELLTTALPELLAAIPWPKRMRWGENPQPFARPVHWIVALLGGGVVPFSFAGKDSGAVSYGHRFAAPECFTVDSADLAAFDAALEQRFVMLDQQRRRQAVVAGMQDIAATRGLRLVMDQDLVEETADLVEWPHPAPGDIDGQFMSLPRELLVSSIKDHQKYFVFEKEGGDLAPVFGVVTNNPADCAMDTIVAGNRRVLRARLSDARFFVEEDRKTPLEQYAKTLARVTFQGDLGSIGQKVERFTRLGESLLEMIPAGDRDQAAPLLTEACTLAKADLNSQAVFEFPELQGIMGRYYALFQGKDEALATAIASHWRPRFSEDAPPDDPLGAVVSIADKMDTVVGCFCVGLKPTGAKDAFALRRQAIGIINTLLARAWDGVDLPRLQDQAANLVAPRAKLPMEQVRVEVAEFFAARFEQSMVDAGFSRDVVQAVLATGLDNPVKARAKITAVAAFSAHPDFPRLAAAFKRVGNILAKQGGDMTPGEVDEGVFVQEEERELHRTVTGLSATVRAHVAAGGYDDALKALAAVKDSVDRFFDGVMVMAEDESLRRNRIALLYRLRELFADIADFRKISAG